MSAIEPANYALLAAAVREIVPEDTRAEIAAVRVEVEATLNRFRELGERAQRAMQSYYVHRNELDGGPGC